MLSPQERDLLFFVVILQKRADRVPSPFSTSLVTASLSAPLSAYFSSSYLPLLPLRLLFLFLLLYAPLKPPEAHSRRNLLTPVPVNMRLRITNRKRYYIARSHEQPRVRRGFRVTLRHSSADTNRASPATPAKPSKPCCCICPGCLLVILLKTPPPVKTPLPCPHSIRPCLRRGFRVIPRHSSAGMIRASSAKPSTPCYCT